MAEMNHQSRNATWNQSHPNLAALVTITKNGGTGITNGKETERAAWTEHTGK